MNNENIFEFIPEIVVPDQVGANRHASTVMKNDYLLHWSPQTGFHVLSRIPHDKITIGPDADDTLSYLMDDMGLSRFDSVVYINQVLNGIGDTIEAVNFFGRDHHCTNDCQHENDYPFSFPLPNVGGFYPA